MYGFSIGDIALCARLARELWETLKPPTELSRQFETLRQAMDELRHTLELTSVIRDFRIEQHRENLKEHLLYSLPNQICYDVWEFQGKAYSRRWWEMRSIILAQKASTVISNDYHSFGATLI